MSTPVSGAKAPPLAAPGREIASSIDTTFDLVQQGFDALLAAGTPAAGSAG